MGSSSAAGRVVVAVGVATALAALPMLAGGTILADPADEETGYPPTQNTSNDSLSEGLQATLWANASGEFVDEETYVDIYGEPRAPLHTLANATDVSFNEPPDTASIWTRDDLQSLPGTDDTRSVAPPHAELQSSPLSVDGAAIRDAHLTTFGAHPSTIVHADDGSPTRYVAPEGTVRGIVDYRIELPDRSTFPDVANVSVPGNITVQETVYPREKVDSEVSWTRIDHDDAGAPTTVEGPAANRTVVLPYEELQSPQTLQIAAEIEVEYVRERRTVRYHCSAQNGTDAGPTIPSDPEDVSCERVDVLDVESTAFEDDLTVTDRPFDAESNGATSESVSGIPTVSYDPQVQAALASYPDGDVGLMVYEPLPWSSVSLSQTSEPTVQTGWRFFTARDDRWTTLEYHSNSSTGPTRNRSHGVPVAVHAYPAVHDPYVSGDIDRPEILAVDGQEQPTPALPANVTVPVEEGETYSSTDVVVLRDESLDAAAVEIRGIVRNSSLSVSDYGATEYPVKESELSMQTIDANDTHTRLRIELRVAETGAPIDLGGPAAGGALQNAATRPGYVTVGDRRIETGANGTATVWVSGHGRFDARYHPGSWLAVQPAYTGDTAEAYQSPEVLDVGFTLEFLLRLLAIVVPVAVAAWAGTKLGGLIPGSSKRRP